MKNIFKYSSIILVSAVLVQSCKSDLKSPEPTAGEANFAKYISVGNSLTAGYADGGLYLDGQKVAYPNLIAEQIKLAGLGANDFTSPFFTEAQKDGSGYRVLKGFFPDGSPDVRSIPANPANFVDYAGSQVSNFGVPGIRLADINTPGYATANILMGRFCGSNKFIKYLDWVGAQNHTFFSFWLGNNDILLYALNGAVPAAVPLAPPPTSETDFRNFYKMAMDKLTANSAKGVIATIPDVTSIPYFSTVLPKTIREKLKAAAFPLLPTPPAGTRYVVCYKNSMGKIKALNDEVFVCLPADSIGVSKGGYPKGIALQLISNDSILNTAAAYPLNNNDVLDEIEQTSIKSIILSYNKIITLAALDYNLALVDANGYLAKVKKEGVIVDGTSITSAYISGGAFSLDGVHLTPRGNALAANQFIDAINEKYGSNIPKLQVTKYDGVKVK